MPEPVFDYVLGDEIGSVALVDQMGGDHKTVNAARVSFGKRIDLVEEKDKTLINYLAEERHTSPFEHVAFTFLIKCPLFVARQWHRHRTWSYNEVSRRYTGENFQFYTPSFLRAQGGKEDKQQSDANKTIEWVNGDNVADIMDGIAYNAITDYNALIDAGVAREQARMILPQNMYTEYYGTVNLHNLMHFIRLRIDSHAQWEIRQYAEAMLKQVKAVAPVSVEAIEKTWS